MYQSVNFDMINVHGLGFEESLAMAKKYGFKGVELSPQMIIDYGVDKAKRMLDEFGIVVSCFGLPLHPIGSSEHDYEASLKELPAAAKAMQDVGCNRTITWLISSSDMEYDECYDFHVKRISPVAKILNEYGIWFGLEFIGPKCVRKVHKYEFIYTAEKMLDLAKDCGSNCGLLFDLWHWYSGANNRDVLKNIADQKYIVNLHVNDAPIGDPDELPDSPRALPGETGVIDAGFILNGLREMNYQGPVVAEPFSTVLAEMDDNDEKVALVKKHLDLIWNK